MPLTWSLTKSTTSSTNACVFDGTPAVALRVTSHRKPKHEHADDQRRDERVDVDRPEAAPRRRASPGTSGGAGCTRSGYVGAAAIGGTFDSSSRPNKAMRNTITVITKAAKNAAGTTSLYVASTSQSWPTITRILPASARNIATIDAPAEAVGPSPQHDREHDRRGQRDQPAQHGRQRCVTAGPHARDGRDRDGRDRLPTKDRRIGLDLSGGVTPAPSTAGALPANRANLRIVLSDSSPGKVMVRCNDERQGRAAPARRG